MERKNLIKKGLAIAVITLFIGIAVAPSINANLSKEKELVEVTTELCGFSGRKQTVKLTQEEAEEVEALFDSIREQMRASESREDTEEIFKEAVVELDKYGLLGGLSVKQAQRLVTFNNAIQRHYSISDMADNENAFCWIIGKMDDTSFVGPLSRPAVYLMRIGWFGPIAISLYILGDVLFILTILLGITTFFTLSLGSLITFGYWYDGPVSWGGRVSHGWLETNGLNGYKEWDKHFKGDLYEFRFLWTTYFVGVEGYFGIRISVQYEGFPPDEDTYILGFARKVKIE